MVLDADLFRNGKDFKFGVSYRDERGEPVGKVLAPGDEIYLTKDQQRQVARAPRRPEDNPFVNGTLVLVAAGADIDSARPIGGMAHQPFPAPPEAVSGPEGAPEGGSAAEPVVVPDESSGDERVGVLTREHLEGLKRTALNAKAKKLGVKQPDQMGNKGEVIDAILAART